MFLKKESKLTLYLPMGDEAEGATEDKESLSRTQYMTGITEWYRGLGNSTI